MQAEDLGDDRAEDDRGPHPREQAFDGLVRRHVGRERAPTDARPDEVADDVVPDRADHETDDHPDAVGVDEQEAGETAEHADVRVPEHGDGRVHHRPRVHDLREVPEQREREHDRRHQRERSLAVVVRDADECRRSEQTDERRRLEAGAPEALVELEGGDARRWR